MTNKIKRLIEKCESIEPLEGRILVHPLKLRTKKEMQVFNTDIPIPEETEPTCPVDEVDIPVLFDDDGNEMPIPTEVDLEDVSEVTVDEVIDEITSDEVTIKDGISDEDFQKQLDARGLMLEPEAEEAPIMQTEEREVEVSKRFQEAIVLKTPEGEKRLTAGDTVIYGIGSLYDFDFIKDVSILHKYDPIAKIV